MRYSINVVFALLVAMIMVFVPSAHGAKSVSIRSLEGKEYAKYLERSCKAEQWNVIAPFLEKSKFNETKFPSYDFEVAENSIRSERGGFSVEVVDGRSRMTIEGRVFEGSLCEIVTQFARDSKVARASIFDLLIPRAEARRVLKTERTNMDYVKWAGIAVAAGGAAAVVAASGVVTGGATWLLAGSFVAAGGGAILGDWLSPTMDFNRRLLETEATNAHFTATACTPTTVVLRSKNGVEATLTRGRDPDLYLKSSRYEGRLRASFSARAKYLARHFAECTGPQHLAKFGGPRQQARIQQRRLEAQAVAVPPPPSPPTEVDPQLVNIAAPSTARPPEDLEFDDAGEDGSSPTYAGPAAGSTSTSR